MSTLSANQIAFLAQGAGFKGDAIVTITAIALAESAGNPDAIGDVNLENATWGPSVGLTQIRSLNQQKGSGGQRDEVANHNPATNLKNAYAISANGTKFSAWSTFTSGAYTAHLSAAKSGAGAPNASGIPAGSGGGTSAATTSTNPFTALLDGSLWLRIAAFVMGGALLVFALLKLTGTDTTVISGVKRAVKTAGVAAL